MTADQAKLLAHLLRKKYGTGHCSSMDCPTCATRALDAEVTRLDLMIMSLRRQLDSTSRRRDQVFCQTCSTRMVDGLCGSCGL